MGNAATKPAYAGSTCPATLECPPARIVWRNAYRRGFLVLDRAGWHSSLRLRVPDHVYLHFLPPYSPELQPAEHLWSLTNAPSINRHFPSIEALEEAQVQRCVALQA